MRPPRLTLTQFCSVPEAAALLGVNRATVNRWIRDGTLTAGTLGRMLLIPREAVEKLVLEKRGQAAEAILPALTMRPPPEGEVRATFHADVSDPKKFTFQWECEGLVMTAQAELDQDPKEWARLVDARRLARAQKDGGEPGARKDAEEEDRAFGTNT